MRLKPEATQFELRRMIQADLETVAQIEQQAYAFPWTWGIFNDCLEAGYPSWVMLLEEEIIGYGMMIVAVGECQILNICIRPDLQRRGLGRAMLQYLLQQARRLGAQEAYLEVRASNQAAGSLYASLGFNEVGRRKGYYPDHEGREDARVMSLSLSDAPHGDSAQE